MTYLYNHLEGQVQCQNSCVPWIPELEHGGAKITDPWLVVHPCSLSLLSSAIFHSKRNPLCLDTQPAVQAPSTPFLAAALGYSSRPRECTHRVWSAPGRVIPGRRPPRLSSLGDHVVLEGERGRKYLVFRIVHYEGRHLQGFWAVTLLLLGHPTSPALCVGVLCEPCPVS